jgi:predicted aspartyl protease
MKLSATIRWWAKEGRSCVVAAVALLFFGTLLTTAVAGAEDFSVLHESMDFYEYTDVDGVIHFVDGMEKIPARYRDRVVVRKDTPAARQTTRVLVADHQIHVPVTLRNGDRSVQAVMLLDTGASMTTITGELAARLNIATDTARQTTTRLADGRRVAISVARIDGVAVGARTKSPLEIGILQHQGDPELHDGLLGLDFLGEFQYQIDMANGLIRWQ